MRNLNKLSRRQQKLKEKLLKDRPIVLQIYFMSLILVIEICGIGFLSRIQVDN